MNAIFKNAWGYQEDKMNLPVEDVDAAIPFYDKVMGFRVVSRSEDPYLSAVLERDNIQIGLAQNGGDSSQDGCAFEVNDVDALFAEFKSNGLERENPDFSTEKHNDGAEWKVFFVIAPDGLCYWFGERTN